MNISYNWLKQYLNFDHSPEEISEILTYLGMEIKGETKFGEELEQIIIGQIVEKKQHPQADKLSICRVDDGNEIKQVICGAPNCAVNQKIAFAPIGTSIGEYKIKKVKLRGEESYGMICSEKELGISDNHDGILILNENAPIGENLSSFLKDRFDTCFEAEITPNRPDLLGMIGIARDLAAYLKFNLNILEINYASGEDKIENFLKLQNNEPKLCSRYTARVIQNVQVKDSPEWLQQRLISVGLRPINNIVDITNFVMMEFGHPLHAFDYEKLEERKVIIRRASKNEKFPALDENVYELDENVLVIADASKPIAIAGVIGGENSHITEKTKTVVIEAANFLYSSIRKTANRFKIQTDSSHRFERDLADETAEIVSQRAAQLILDIAGGTLLKGKLDSYPNPEPENIVSIRPSRARKLLTIDLTKATIQKHLEGLGLKQVHEEEDLLQFKIPPFRKDLTREIDLIEEIIRMHGYNNIETYLKPQKIMNKYSFYKKREVQDFLVNSGFSEVVNWSFSDPNYLNLLKIDENDKRSNFVKIKNPLGNSFSVMRSLLLPGILKNALFNINHGKHDLKLFELSKTFIKKEGKLANERFFITGLMTGDLHSVYWKEPVKKVDFYDIKGIVEDILEISGLSGVQFSNSKESCYQPGLAAEVSYKNSDIANFGKLDPKIAQSFEIEQPVFVFDIDLDEIFKLHKKENPEFIAIPKYPPVLRDLSFIIPNEYKLSKIKEEIFKVNRKLIKKVIVFDEYTGKNIEKGYRSLTFNLILSSDTKTLTDEFVNGLLQKIIKTLQIRFNIEMR